MCTKFYQNRLDFVEDMTQTFGVFFSVHSVVCIVETLEINVRLILLGPTRAQNLTILSSAIPKKFKVV